jgi:spore coat polysaccharide biosynthesis protein SpsF
MKFSIIVEARSGSKRLPNKILLKIKNFSFLEYLLIRLIKIKNIENFIVATTKNIKDKAIIKIAKKNNFKYFAGSEKNVLKRVLGAAKKFSCQNIIRITSDCPLIDVRIIRKAIKLFKISNCDYLSNTIKRSYPDGMDVEIFKLSALKKASRYANSSTHKEWTTWSIIKNPKIFRIKQFISEKKFFNPKLGLTLDYFEDYVFLKKIILFFGVNKIIKCDEILRLLKKKKDWLKINDKVKRNIE